jgi:hypothetical protein
VKGRGKLCHRFEIILAILANLDHMNSFTVQVKNGVLLFWWEQKRTKNRWNLFMTKICSCPSLKLPSPDQYLFHCSIQNNAGGDETTFAFAVTHHQNLSQG